MSEEEIRESSDVEALDESTGEAPGEALEGSAAVAEELSAELEQARRKADENWNQVLRLNAEMENLRKRMQREVEGAHKFALEKFVTELLPVRDSLEMGLSAAHGGDGESDKIREGMELTLKQLVGAMEKFGVVQIDPKGERFDPQLHEAMSIQESADHDPNTVLVVMQKGYTLNDRLVRPAMVVVSKAGSEGAPPPSIDVKA